MMPPGIHAGVNQDPKSDIAPESCLEALSDPLPAAFWTRNESQNGANMYPKGIHGGATQVSGGAPRPQHVPLTCTPH